MDATRATFEGKHYRLQDAVAEPKPVQQPHPPIWIGGCLRVVDLGTGFRRALFGCTVQRSFTDEQSTVSENVEPFVVLSADGHWMIVDGPSVAVDTLTVR